MNRQQAIEELNWYLTLMRNKLRYWGGDMPQQARRALLQNIEDVRVCYESILEKQECVSLKMLAITGSDLIEVGMEPGKEIGATLERLLEIVIEHPEYNTKEKLLQLKDE